MWTCEEIVKATGGHAYADTGAMASVSIDTRTLEPGALFIAIKGERFDGHDYIGSALAKGAAAALASRIPEGLAETSRLIMVDDTYKALVDLATASRSRMRGKIIAVTGSVGKTGTKEAIRTALAESGGVYATRGNLNNHIGLPLSLANMAQSARFGVFELGMNHSGEISYLTKILRPDIAVITNVEAVHLEFFKSVQEIADAKAEIMEGLDKNGAVVLNRDNAYYEHLLGKTHAHGIKNVITFGEHFDADCRLANYALKNFGSQIEAVIKGTPITYRTGTVGHHWALTSVIVLAVITAAGAYLPDAVAALANFHEPEGRGRIQLIDMGDKIITLIDDCYNASPVSTIAAIAKLAELHASMGGKGRRIAVLGDMLELGNSSADLHKSLLATLQQHAIDRLYAAGKFMKHLYDITPPGIRGAYAEKSADLAKAVVDGLSDGDVVLIKGSHGSRMDIIRDIILKKKELADAV